MSSPSLATKGPNQKLSSEDIKLRGSLLAKDRQLLRLHKELVSGGLLSEEEFWETRQGLLRAQEALLRQRRATAATPANEETAKPVAGTTGAGDIKYVLTPAIIKGIFESHPILKQAFSALVRGGEQATEPPVLTEKEFWVEYFKSRFFNEKLAAGAGSALLDPYHETETREKRTAEENDCSLEKFAGMVDESLDISRSLDDHVSSQYVQPEGEGARSDSHRSALRHFNLQSLKLLQSNSSAGEKGPRGVDERGPELSDLQAPREPVLATLNIQGSLLGRRSEPAMDADVDYEAIKRDLLAGLVAEKRDHLAAFGAYKQSLSSLLASNGFPLVGQQEPLRAESSDELAHLMASCLEILRHFWRAAGMSNAAERGAKLAKMHQVLLQMEAKVDAHVAASPASARAVLNLRQVFAVAKLKYQELCK